MYKNEMPNGKVFHKLWKEGNVYRIRKTKEFEYNYEINKEFVLSSFNYAYWMAFEKGGSYRDHRKGGVYRRSKDEIFIAAFQGKLSEYSFYQFFSRKSHILITAPDDRILSEGKWDNVDMKFINMNNPKKKTYPVTIKSTKSAGNLLLLETGDWTVEGYYRPDIEEESITPVDYAYYVLVRIGAKEKTGTESYNTINTIYKELKKKSDVISYMELKSLVMNIDWFYDIPGYITKEEFKYIASKEFIIHQGEMIKVKGIITMDADNYYIQAGDLHPITK